MIFHRENPSVSPVSSRPIESVNIPQLLFSFKGRINRKLFWISIIFSWVAIGIAYALFLSIPTLIPEMNRTISIPLIIVLIALPLVFVYTQMAITAKRLHDTNRSAWLLCWIGVTNIIHFGKLGGNFRSSIFDIIMIAIVLYFIVTCGFFKGDPEPNKYGNPPKQLTVRGFL